jgi:hypothetical protein
MKHFIAAIVFSVNALCAQVSISGKVHDEKNEAIPYAAIGSLKHSTAVLSNEKGFFRIELKEIDVTDSIKFYAIGFKEQYIPITQLKTSGANEIRLSPSDQQLEEVEVSAKKLYRKKLGVLKYDKTNCTGFVGLENNWKGVEAAIRITNETKKLMKIVDFQFYIIKNTLPDSLAFRLNIYSSNEFYPTKNILKKSIIFKTNLKQGEVSLDLSAYDIKAYDDFFVSLECLMEKVSIADFCFAGQNNEPAYIRESVFKKWKKVRGGGGAFNVSVLYQKKN